MSFRLIPLWLLNRFSIFTLSFTQQFFINHCPTLPTQVFIGKYTLRSQTECSYFAHCPHDVCPSDFQSVDAKDIILAHTRRTQPFFLCVRLISFINVFCLMSSNHLFEKWINFFRPLKFVPSLRSSPLLDRHPSDGHPNIFGEIFLCGFPKQ